MIYYENSNLGDLLMKKPFQYGLISKFLIIATLFGNTLQSEAVSIYPINQAEILVGSKFDLKIEFDKVLEPNEAIITLNDQDIVSVLKARPDYIRNEDGKGSSFVWRNVSLENVGSVKITARTADVKAIKPSWKPRL